MNRSSLRVGIVGLGRMGANMARRLKDCGYRVTVVSDLCLERTRALASELSEANELGEVCQATSDLGEVTRLSDLVLTVVTDDAAMRSLFSESGSSLLRDAHGTTFLNCATVSPAVHQEIERAAEKVGASSLEVCMASSISQAREGTLYLMVGGKEEVFLEHQALLEDLAKELRYIGVAGQAAQVKALVNMVMNINTAALAEGLGLGQALGLDPGVLCEVFSQTGANSRVLETDAGDMIDRDHECWFSAAHAAKDSGIANGLAEEKGLSLPLSEVTQRQYEKMMELGIGELDKSGIAELTFLGRGV